MVDFAGERAVVVERFDRIRSHDDVIRIHQEDMCQALGVHPEQKYESDGGPSAMAIGDLLRTHIPGRDGSAAVQAFAEALAFNWIIGAPDAHAKNYGLLLSGRQVRLAPLYDVASALPHSEFYEPKLKLAMKIGGTYQAARMTAENWQVEAGRLRLSPDWLTSRVRELADATPEALVEACRADDITPLGSQLPARLLDRVAARARRCARSLH